MTDVPYIHPDGLLLTQRHGEVTVVTMNDPRRRNPFSLAMRHALTDAFRQLFNADAETRAIVLTGAGDNFCAGGDLSEMTTAPPLMALRERIQAGCAVFREICSGSKPVVVAVEGACIGAGLSLACSGDLVVAADSSKFGCAFVKVGLLPDTGLLWTLPQKVGASRARQLMLDGRSFTADEALEWGMVSEKVAAGKALEVAVATARRFAAFPPATLALLRGALVDGMNTIDDACRLEIDLNPLVRQTADHQEAVKAFMEKRAPVFSGD